MDNSKSKRPTLRDVAKIAGVSSQTVSRVINNQGRVSDETRENILKIIKDIGYRPNRAAQMLNTRRSFTLEVLTVDPETSLFKSTLTQMTASAQEHGYNISFTVFKRGELDEALEHAAARLIDGAILIPSLFLPDFEEPIDSSNVIGIPSVQITPMLSLAAPSVAYDQAAGVRMIAKHLIELGHTQFAEISGRAGMLETQIRHESWITTAHNHNLDPGVVESGDFTVAGGYQAAQKLLARGARCTALICANDRTAIGALHALSEHGLRVPDDVSVVGFDNIENAAHSIPPLTTVAIDFNKLGQLAVDYLVELIDKPNTPGYQRVLMPELVIRNSTGPAQS